jgi:hypothetical protein
VTRLIASAEVVGELGVPVTFNVPDERLQAQNVAQTRLRVSDDVVSPCPACR